MSMHWTSLLLPISYPKSAIKIVVLFNFTFGYLERFFSSATVGAIQFNSMRGDLEYELINVV